jgi:hypothetical protein
VEKKITKAGGDNLPAFCFYQKYDRNNLLFQSAFRCCSSEFIRSNKKGTVAPLDSGLRRNDQGERIR